MLAAMPLRNGEVNDGGEWLAGMVEHVKLPQTASAVQLADAVHVHGRSCETTPKGRGSGQRRHDCLSLPQARLTIHVLHCRNTQTQCPRITSHHERPHCSTPEWARFTNRDTP